MKREQALIALQALANAARLDLLRLLMAKGKAGLAAGEIGQCLGHSPSRLSFHLNQLEQAGLIQSRRDSRNVFYSADPAGLGGVLSYLLNDCCMDHPEVIACCAGAARRAVQASLAPVPDETGGMAAP
jgi:ArsR family transcriptional regulator